MRALSLLSMMAVLLIGIVATPDTLADAAKPTADNAMAAIKGPLDRLNVWPSAFKEKADKETGAGNTLKIVIAPIHIEYPKKRHDLPPYYHDSDFQLTPRDVELLQKTVADTFTASWFEKRHWQLVTDPSSTDLRLNVDLKDFRLTAPLKESIQVYRTYAEESVRFTLSGNVERIGDGQRLIEFSDKRKVRQLGTPPGRMERFTVVTFWRDIRLELSAFAGQLNRLVPQATTTVISAQPTSGGSVGSASGNLPGKNGHEA